MGYVSIDENNRVIAHSKEKIESLDILIPVDNEELIDEFTDFVSIRDISDFVYQNGTLIYSPIIEKQYMKELQDLQAWFIEYDSQTAQYQRCLRLGIEYDKDISELDTEAQQKQMRIRELRELLNKKEVE